MSKTLKNTSSAQSTAKVKDKKAITLTADEELSYVKRIFAEDFKESQKVTFAIPAISSMFSDKIKMVVEYKKLTDDEYTAVIKDFLNEYPNTNFVDIKGVSVPTTHAAEFALKISEMTVRKLTRLAVGLAANRIKPTGIAVNRAKSVNKR